MPELSTTHPPAEAPVQAPVQVPVQMPVEFTELADRHRGELTAHCYRMTGSVFDAEDLVQETLLRAWRAYERFEGRSSARTWLYRIATNVCLTALEGKAKRPLPVGLGAPGSQAGDALELSGEVPWLEPVPDVLVDAGDVDPAQVVGNRDSIRLAFVAALQHLPPRQRAVLVLRDVLRWSAAETAEAWGTTSSGVNSALQRAHARLAATGLDQDRVEDDLSAELQAMLDRYVAAFWAKDVQALVRLLAEDAVWEMPPFVGWYAGAENVANVIDAQCPGGRGDMPMLATMANGQPAFGLYMRQEDGSFASFHLQVVSVVAGLVQHVAVFFDPRLFATFDLPEALPADWSPAAPTGG